MTTRLECPTCGTWVCSECNWKRIRASRNEKQVCGNCGSWRGEMLVTMHSKKTYAVHTEYQYAPAPLYPLERWDYWNERYYTDDEIALDKIAEAMSGKEWSADTLDIIAGFVRDSGREIRDLDDSDDD